MCNSHFMCKQARLWGWVEGTPTFLTGPPLPILPFIHVETPVEYRVPSLYAVGDKCVTVQGSPNIRLWGPYTYATVFC